MRPATLGLVLLSLALVTGAGACGGEDEEAAPAPREEEPVLLVCPVEGTRFAGGEGTTVSFEGRSRELCSPGCAFRFAQDPRAFLEGGEAR